MNKKILIASLFATLMLLVPMSSVVGVSDVDEDCGCQVVNRYDLFRVKLLLVRLKVITNILLLRFGHIPEVAEKCYEILENLDINKLWDSPIICDTLYQLSGYFGSWYWFFNILSTDVFEENPILSNIFNNISMFFAMIATSFWGIAVLLDCDWADPFPPFP